MRITPVNSAQYQQKPQKQKEYNIPVNTKFMRQNNNVAFTGNFFSNLSAKLKDAFTDKPGDRDKRFDKVLKQATYC